MTTIKRKDRPTWHQTGASISGRQIVVAEHPINCLLRLKGTRQVLQVPWTVCFLRAAAIKAIEVARLKAERRKQRKAVR